MTRIPRPGHVAAALAVLVASFHTVGIVRFVLTHGSFQGGGDDAEGFWMSTHVPFWTYLFIPTDVHRIPLHRLISYLVYRAAPLNFTVAEMVLVFFHIGGCAFLFGTLDKIRRTPWNYVLVAWYAVNPYLGPQLFWWTSGVGRLPYILFSTAATYYYLKYRTDGARSSFALVIVCQVLSLGFFMKGVLIPAVLGALELGLRWCDSAKTGSGSFETRQRRRVWTVLSATALVSAVYLVAWRAATPPLLRQASTDPHFVLEYLKLSWLVFGMGAAGYLPEDVSSRLWVGLAWVVALVYCISQKRKSLTAWVFAATLISLNMYGGTSQFRASTVGPMGALWGDRYYLELAPLVVVFAGAALAGFRRDSAERAVFRSPIVRWSGAFLTVAAIAFVSVISYRSTKRLFVTRYAATSHTREFLDNLRRGLEDVRRDADGTWAFVDSPIPRDLEPAALHPNRMFELLQLMGERPRLVFPRPKAYWITESGRLFRL